MPKMLTVDEQFEAIVTGDVRADKMQPFQEPEPKKASPVEEKPAESVPSEEKPGESQ